MSGPLFEQYREALRRGHMSTLEGRLEDALEAYREAARLVPERTLALASLGTVLHKLDRWPEAAEAYDKALRVDPDDEATLRARGTAREERSMRSGAASDFERLAFVLDVAGRLPDAAEAARRANELEPTGRRAALAARLERAAGGGDPAPGDGDAAEEAAAAPAATAATPAPAATAATAPIAAQPAQVAAPPRRSGGAWPVEDDLAGLRRVALGLDAPAPAAAARAAEEVPPGPIVDEQDGANWPAIDLPSPPPPPLVGPPPDTEELMAEAAAIYEAGDLAGAVEKMLTAVAVHRAAGRLDAALDVCFQLLAITPGDPHVHLAIANLQLDRGWSPLAREKLDLLVRLTALTGDTQAEADAHGVAAERLRDEPVASASRR